PRYIREEPYIPTAIHFPPYAASELGVEVNPDASVYCLPGVAAYVGGDITAGILSSGVYKTAKLSLFMDVGTNGEIVLGNKDWAMTCACSAGPAFEGGGVQCGMRATIGAIEDIRIDSNTLEPTISVIGDTRPLGICGSGMIAALAEMLVTGIVDRGGRIHLNHSACRPGICRLREGEHGDEYVLVWASDSGTGQDIVINEVDINNLIRTKAAIYAGITVMLRSLNIDLESLEQVLIGGAFGQHINIEEAIQIGLLPDLPWERFKFLGNTSAQGSYHALLSREARSTADEIARRLTYLELIAENTFMDEFTSALFLPHTNLDAFPSVKTLLIREGG
ncbi:MAG: ASKHA domain-containing protein, partial [Dehalococcoidia bacterium]|nr:ASKHA domain-containing protein [Dehalococcoidia bacterium]